MQDERRAGGPRAPFPSASLSAALLCPFSALLSSVSLGLPGKPCRKKSPASSSCSPITHPPRRGCCVSTCR